MKPGRGIRTRFSDDLLWLAYATLEYIDFTGDTKILDIETPYLKGEILKEGEDERYDRYIESGNTGTIYEHCIKAIEKSLNFGEHGLPKIGSGDWNDGMNEVGNKGKGESIWLGFFLYNILPQWSHLTQAPSGTIGISLLSIKGTFITPYFFFLKTLIISPTYSLNSLLIKLVS